MDLVLNDEQLLLREAAQKLGMSRGGPRRARALRETGTEVDFVAWDEMIQAGWLSALVEEKHEGLGLGIFDLALALEETGKHIVMLPFVEAAGAMWAVSRAVEANHPAMAAILSKIVVPATLVPGQNYDGATGMMFDPEALMLSGQVSFVPFGASADLFLVDANGGSLTLLCLVSRNAAGLSIKTTPNVDGSTSSTLTFSGVKIMEDQIVSRGDPAAKIVTAMRELLVLGTAAELLGVAEAAFDMTLAYTKLREQFGKQIGSFQALQHRMVDCYVDNELNRSLLFKVLSAWDDRTSHPAMVSAVKARVGKGALTTVRTALQLHGAIGYTDEHDIGLYYKRAVALAAKFGNEITHVGRFSKLTTLSRL
jgi:alkylation response protein AidB-like acyl-CoA dehydrogenase